MFGINSFEQFGQIAEGWTKDILDLERELYNERMPICEECPLYTNDPLFHGKCDENKYYNPKTGELDSLPGAGFINGCGCKLSAKTRLKHAHCPLDKWKK